MTQYGLMAVTQMNEEESVLLRARLHLRGGKRRLQEGLSTAGLMELYDSLLFGMHYYVAIDERCKEIGITSSDTLGCCSSVSQISEGRHP